jgi:hypothetical protein
MQTSTRHVNQGAAISTEDRKRPVASYRHAIRWIVANDDTEWLRDCGNDDDPTLLMSVTAALVADLFNKTDQAVCADLARELERRRLA